jgi:hypothetical protein
MKIKNSLQPKLTGGALVLAIATSVYGQTAASADAGKTATTPATDSSTAAVAAPKANSFVRLDGNDLIVGSLPPVTFHGFASQGFLDTTSYNYLAANTKGGSFQFNEFGLNASTSPFARTRISAQAFMFDVGNVGNYDLGLDYAVIDYNFADEIGIRAGRIRRPEGIYNSIQDIDLARTSVLLPQGMYDARWRDFSASVDGGSVYGNVGLGKVGSVSYEVYGGMINLSQQGGVAREVQNGLLNTGLSLSSVNDCPLVGGQIWWNTPVDGLRLGVALTEGFNFNIDEAGVLATGQPFPFNTVMLTRHSRLNVPTEHYSVEYVKDKWTFQGEAKFQTLIEKDTTSQNFPNFPAANSTSATHSDSTSVTWYAGAAYEVNHWFQTGAYYTEYYNGLSDLGGGGPKNYQRDLALSFRFDPKPWWIIKVEGHYLNGTALVRDDIHNPSESGNGWFMLALKTTVSF